MAQAIFVITSPETGVISGVYDSLAVIQQSFNITYSKRPEAKPILKHDHGHKWSIRVQDRPNPDWVDACIDMYHVVTEPEHL